MSEIEKLRAERNLFAGKYRSMATLMEDARCKIRIVSDGKTDEGDRVYFGSTNHADWLQDLADEMESWLFDFELPKGDINKMERDPYAQIREQRARAEKAEAALKKIAAYDDAAACAHLRATGSYASFDEPGSVEIARKYRISLMTIVTTTLIKEIRYFRSIGLSRPKTAALLGIHKSTVEKYESDQAVNARVAYERDRHLRELNNPVVAERKRSAAREWQRRARSER